MENRTIGILGLGIFGQSVLKTLQDQDVDIIAIDDHAEHVEPLAVADEVAGHGEGGGADDLDEVGGGHGFR